LSQGEDERLRLFERSLSRFAGVLGLRVNVELSRKVEEVQLKIMDDVTKVIDKIWSQGLTLQDLLARLSNDGVLREEAVYASKAIGESLNPDSVDDVLASAISGDVSQEGAKSTLIAFQAIARAYASRYFKENGSIEHLSPYCPLCGAESRTMVKRGDKYVMVCHLCGYEWVIGRGSPVCPFCGNDNKFKLGTFMDKERKYGLMFCQECGSYWRVIWDEEMASAPSIVLPLLAMAAERFRTALPKDIVNNSQEPDAEVSLNKEENETEGKK
jgi:FdhE protein